MSMEEYQRFCLWFLVPAAALLGLSVPLAVAGYYFWYGTLIVLGCSCLAMGVNGVLMWLDSLFHFTD